MTIKEYSAERIGQTWTMADHERLCFAISVVHRTATDMVNQVGEYIDEQRKLRTPPLPLLDTDISEADIERVLAGGR